MSEEQQDPPRSTGRKRVIVDRAEWAIGDDADKVVAQIDEAMSQGTVAELQLLDGANRVVTVRLNGKVVPWVVVDLDVGSKPSEISN